MGLRNNEVFQLEWYIEHRIEFLTNQHENVRLNLLSFNANLM